MTDRITVDLFAEDKAHEEFLRALIDRLARKEGKDVVVRVQSARGGHGRAITELKIYQKIRLKVGGGELPNILVIAIDGNCKPFADAKREIEASLESGFQPIAAVACPEPHIERWFLADPAGCKQVIGIAPRLSKRKCDRNVYKKLLSDTVEKAGHISLLGGIEFARELVEVMDLDHVSKAEKSFHAFIDSIVGLLRNS